MNSMYHDTYFALKSADSLKALLIFFCGSQATSSDNIFGHTISYNIVIVFLFFLKLIHYCKNFISLRHVNFCFVLKQSSYK